MKTIALIISGIVFITPPIYYAVNHWRIIKKYKEKQVQGAFDEQLPEWRSLTFKSSPEMVKRMLPKKRSRYEFKQTKEEFQKWINQ